MKSLGDERIESLELSDGRTVDTDLVIAGLGADPAVEWLRGSGIDYDTKGGVRTDAALRCSVEGVVAAGDVVSWLNPSDGHRRQRVEHWTCGSAQGQAVARALLEGANARPFAHVPTFWSESMQDSNPRRWVAPSRRCASALLEQPGHATRDDGR